MLKLFNTLTHVKDEVPEANTTSIYTCGPTVYLDLHIGNWRTFITYDTLTRTIKSGGQDVNHILNITDVGHLVGDGDEGEDKLVVQAREQRKTAWEIADFYTQKLYEGQELLNIKAPTQMPKATDHIEEQIELVKTLEEKGHTYTIDDGVYFDTSTFKSYADFAKLDLAGQEEGARVEVNTQKRNASDFALWKLSPEGQKRDMEWESPWGKGFPGWHLECSAMATKYLGKTIDIHAGGVDLMPVHHTNEIAQSEAANNQRFADIWVHSEFMKVDGTKMSKSLGNVYTLADILEHDFDPLSFRLMILQGHYRSETNFSWENLMAAQNRYHKLLQLAERRWQVAVDIDAEQNTVDSLDQAIQDTRTAIEDDLNTPRVLEIISTVETIVEPGLGAQATDMFIAYLELLDELLGLNLLDESPDIDDESKELIDKRAQAKATKDFSTADSIRDELLESDIELLDRANGSFWARKR